MKESWVFRPPESVFGFGVINKTPNFVGRLGASRVMMITDQGVRITYKINTINVKQCLTWLIEKMF